MVLFVAMHAGKRVRTLYYPEMIVMLSPALLTKATTSVLQRGCDKHLYNLHSSQRRHILQCPRVQIYHTP